MKKPRSFSEGLGLGIPDDDWFIGFINKAVILFAICMLVATCFLGHNAGAQCQYDPYCNMIETHRQQELQQQQHWNDYNMQRERYWQQERQNQQYDPYSDDRPYYERGYGR